jgi:taurine dioxygenase
MDVATGLRISTITPTIGALVEGVRLGEAASDRTIADIRAALLKHKVLFFEDQDLTHVEQRDFARRFGELDVHPLYPGDASAPEIMVLDNHAGNPSDNDYWHTDVTYLERPAMAALLYARQVPASGGDTLWASMTAAYQALSPTMRSFLDGLSAVHDFSHAFTESGLAAKAAGREKLEAARIANPPVVHPVIRVHPETGEKALFVNSVFTARIKGLRREESRALLDFLFAHVQRPDFQVRWRWKPGAVAFWDNRCTQHYAVNDYLPDRRVLTRATVIGDRPVGPSIGEAVWRTG